MKSTRNNNIKRTMQNPKHIPGIYNYCDRWCERCPFTARCMNFQISEETFDSPESRDIENAAFWEKLSDTLHEALALLRESAAEWGIDLDAITAESDGKNLLQQDDDTDNVVHLSLHVSNAYITMVDNWFAPYVDLAGSQPDEDGSEYDYSMQSALPPNGPETEMFRNAVEIIRWYQYQIHVKLKRAIHSAEEEKTEGLEEFPKDSDGSTKVALIGIDRSIAAWGKVLKVFPDQEKETLSNIAYLKRLRDMTEREFPEARAFIRPGFDEGT